MHFVSKIKISINGKSLENFSNISLQQNVFGHHSLKVTCNRDAFEDEGSFILDKSDKILGEEISMVLSAEEEENKNEFKGIITQVTASKADGSFGGNIVISAQSSDILLNDGEHCRSFEEKTLEKIIKQILKEYRFSSNNISPQNSTNSLAYTVQYKESAYAFIRRLATKKGEWFFYNGTDLVFGKLPKKTVTLNYGKDLSHFDFSLKLDDLKFKYTANDYLNDKVLTSDSGSQKVSKISDKAKVAYDKSEKLYTHETQSLYNNSLSESNAQNHLDNRVKLIKSAQASGLVTLTGSSDNPNLILGCEINIVESYGESDKKKTTNHGKYIITNISHSCDQTGNYQNNFSAIPIETDVPPFTTPHAIPFCETQSARVIDNNDPEAMGRIQVQFLWQKADNQVSPWLRIVTPHSGADQGFSFIPEIDDEVLVGFEGGNAEKPYVIGSLYHGNAKPDNAWLNDQNDIKAIRTRSGHTIEFNDSDGGEEVKIYDNGKDNYVITLSSHESKVKIESSGDMELTAKGNMDIKVTSDLNIEAQNIEIKSGMNLKTSATNATSEASAQMELKASAGMKLDGGAQIEQSAGIIKVN